MWGVWLAESVEHAILDPEVVCLSLHTGCRHYLKSWGCEWLSWLTVRLLILPQVKISHFMTKLQQQKTKNRGAWVVQWVECPTLTWIMISQFVSLSPALDSLLSARGLLWILSPSPFLPLLHSCSFSKLMIKNKKD